jgi:hypothetical protein
MRWSSAFVLGIVAGVFLKEGIRRLQESARRTQTQIEHDHTVVYDANMPEPLERREPAPEPGQPRFGGTGAIGFSPATVTPPSK